GGNPEAGHVARVRVGRQPAAGLQLPAEVPELGAAQPAFEEGARVDAGRRVGLDADEVAAVFRTLVPEEVIEPHLQHRRPGCVGAYMATDAGAAVVTLQYHRHGVPAVDVLDA